jgi:hypothetical protein
VAPGGQAGACSTSINGFGGIRVLVQTTPAPYLNGELIRGFGLTFNGVNRFHSTQSVDMAGVTISRAVYVNTGANTSEIVTTSSGDAIVSPSGAAREEGQDRHQVRRRGKDDRARARRALRTACRR